MFQSAVYSCNIRLIGKIKNESILDYYAYIIIGLDFDSYESNSGSASFQQAQQITLIANAGKNGVGWDRIITSSGAF